MQLLLILGCGWLVLFVFSLAMAAANNRYAVETTGADFQFSNPALDLAEEPNGVRETVANRLQTIISSRSSRRSHAGETIYVVDDDPDILNLIKEVLVAEGFDVHPFTNPEEALEDLAHTDSRPRMLLTDFCMQEMNGLDLISKVRSTRPDIKSIVISGVVDQDLINQMPEKSDRFLSKPFAISNLVSTLNETLAEANN
ncbi:MAG: response regulator [Verrucomicrobiota bacterium]|nr:response regulator [Verrucomicrobiota bacterium]